MSINISALTEFVHYSPDLIINRIFKQSILQRLPEIMNYPNNNPGLYEYRIFDPKSNLSNCCTLPNGESVVTSRQTRIICLQDRQTYCELDFASLLQNAAIRYTAGNENIGSLEQAVTEAQLGAFQEAIDRLIFLGDTDETDTNLNKLDGLIKISTEDHAAINITTGDLFDAINQGLAALPIDSRRLGKIAVFVGTEYAEAYNEGLLTRNWYHVAPIDFDVDRDQKVAGKANVTIIPTQALDGSNQVLITPLSNVVWFTNRKEDMNTIKWGYAEYHEEYFFYIKMILGIDLKIPAYSQVLTLDPSIMLNCPRCSQTTVVVPGTTDQPIQGGATVPGWEEGAGGSATLSADTKAKAKK